MIHCTFENNDSTSLRHVVMAAIVLNKKNQVLLEKRADHMLRGGKYTVPGGFLDRDEDTAAGILRELKEETGLTGKIKFLFQINDSPDRPKEDRQNIDFVYIVEAEEGELQGDREVATLGWYDFDTIPTEEEFAFDHRKAILKYFDYLKEPFALPIVGAL